MSSSKAKTNSLSTTPSRKSPISANVEFMDSPNANQELATNEFSNVMSGSVSAPQKINSIPSSSDNTTNFPAGPSSTIPLLLNPSPIKTANLLTKTYADQHNNTDAYTIDQICTARVTTIQPSYMYLSNVIPDEQLRKSELDHIMVKLGIEYLDLYPNFITDKTPPTVTGVPIPPLSHSLRQWVLTTHEQTSSTLRDLFTCILRPDPLSSPKFYALYKKREGEKGGESSSLLRTRVNEWNRSQLLLAEVLNTALKNAEALPCTSSMKHMLKLIRTGWKHFSPDTTQMRGHHMFWVLKNILHSEPHQSASSIEQTIRSTHMTLNSLNKPDYSKWLIKIDTLVENLKEYDTSENPHYTDETLLQMFMNNYLTIMPRDQYLYDDIVRAHEAGKLSWATLKNRSYEADLKSFVYDRTLLAATVSDDEDPPPQKVMYAATHKHSDHSSNTASSHTKKQYNKSTSSSAAPPSKPKRVPQELKSPIIDWDPSQPCAIHCVKPGVRVTHNNNTCALQMKARSANKSTQELLTALTEIKATSDSRAAKRKDNTVSPTPKTTTRRVASAAVVITDSDDDRMHLSSETCSSDDEINHRKRSHSDDHHHTHHAAASSRLVSPINHELHSDDFANDTDSSEGSIIPQRPDEMEPDDFNVPPPSELAAQIEKMMKRDESRRRSSEARKRRHIADKEFLLTTNTKVVDSDTGELVLYCGKTAAQWAAHLCSIIKTPNARVNINRVMDDVALAYTAEYRYMTNRREQPPIRRYFSLCGLQPVDIEHLSRKARRKFTVDWKVISPPPFSLIANANTLPITHSASNTTETTSRVWSHCAPTSNSCRHSSSKRFVKISPIRTPLIKHRINVATCHTSKHLRIVPHSKALMYSTTTPEYDSIIDTGATCHMLRDEIFASHHYQFQPTNAKVALGDHGITLKALGTCSVGILRKALVVPKMSLNLISGSRLERAGYYLVVRNSECTIHNLRGEKIYTAKLFDGLYCFLLKDFLECCVKQSKTEATMVAKIKKPSTVSTKFDVELLHKRFGHASVEDIIRGLKNGTITGFTIDTKREHGKYQLQNGVCSTCMKAKSHKPPFYTSVSPKAYHPGEYIVCDIQGPYSIDTIHDQRYVLTYTDWFTRYSWTFLLTKKSEALSKLKYLVEVVFAAQRVSLRHYHSDQAGELQGSDTLHYLEYVIHATHTESEAYTPARNAIAERKFRTLAEMTAAMLFDSGLPKTFWGYAYLAATHIRNRIPTVIRSDCNTPKSPYELWHKRIPNLHYLRRWGCKCFVHIPKQLRNKTFPDKVQTGFLVGFTDQGSYEAYIPELGSIVGPTVQISFDEDIPTHTESYFSELHLQDHTIDVTDKEHPKTVNDYHYLIGQHHIDNEDGMRYITTRVVNQGGYIVAFRRPISPQGTPNRWEDTTPIHIEDIVRMTNHLHTNSGIVTQAVTDVSSLSPSSPTTKKTSGKFATLPQPHHTEQKSLKRKGATSLSKTDAYGISTDGDLITPEQSTHLLGPANTRKHVRFNLSDTQRAITIDSKRERTKRTLTNVSTMGNIASHTTLNGGDNIKPKPSSTFQAFHTMIVNNEFDIDFVPNNYKQAMQSKDSIQWQLAVDKELKSIADNNVFSIVDRPPGIKLQSGRFLFKIKYTGQGQIFKARLIAHGFKQIAGSDYWETYAPVSSSVATRIFLTMCATYGMTIHQMDIDTAFLIADLTEELYMEPPVGMTVPEGKVLKLHKCLYGLKQAPRYFNQHLVGTLLGLGFTNLVNEPCLFQKTVDGKLVLATIYVDDILIACSDITFTQSVKDQLALHYKMKDMGEMDWYLGMRCKRNKKTNSITLDQSKYIDDVLSKFSSWLGPEKNRVVPMQPNLVLSKWTKEYDDGLTVNQEHLVKNFPYRQVIGSLLYMSIWTRPDISYAIGKLSKFNNHPTVEAIYATQWLLQYVRFTKHLGLTFIKGDMKISTYVDSSFADCVQDRRSTAGQITYLGRSPIIWDSFVCDNYTIPCSVAEAEYIAASEAAKVMLLVRNILIQLRIPQNGMFMFEDNQACLTIALQEASSRKTKHVELQVHHIRDLIKSKLIIMVHIPTQIQLADIFTKPLNEETFNRHIHVILGQEPTGDLQIYLRAKEQYNSSCHISDEEDN